MRPLPPQSLARVPTAGFFDVRMSEEQLEVTMVSVGSRIEWAWTQCKTRGGGWRGC